MKDQRMYPYSVNFFRLRPELTLFVLSFIVLFSVIYFLRWNIKTAIENFVDLSRFEMVELEIPVPEIVEPDIATPEEAAEEVPEEKPKEEQLKFGDDRGHYDLSALSVVPPKPRVSSLPPYPDTVRKLGIEGVIVTEIGIDENGSIVYAKIVKKLHPVLNSLVLDWMKTISFYPAIDTDGKSFRCKIFWPIRFQLTD